MPPIVIKLGGYQGPQSINTRAAQRFGEVLVQQLGERIGTERFQAQDNPLTNTYNFGVHRLHRHITLTGHFFGAGMLVCADAWYSALPADVREAVDAAAHAATAYQNELAAVEDDAILAVLDPRENDVVRLSADEMDAFTRAVEPVRTRHLKALDSRLVGYLQ